jgi:PAS domain S-box-containing protein
MDKVFLYVDIEPNNMIEKSQNERNSHFLETINAFGSILMHATSVQDSVWSVAKHAVGKLGYTDCIIYLINDDGELYQCAAHGNKNPTAQEIQNPIKLKMGEGICGHVALTGIGEIIADTSKDHRYTVDDEYRYSEITVPVLSDGNVIGIIDSEHPEKGYFSDQDLILLNTIASMLSLKISQTKAIDELEIHKDNRLNELIISNAEKQEQADKLALANREKQKRADELFITSKELAFQNELAKNRSETESIVEELRQFIETANAPIFGINSKGQINEWNQTSEQLTGYNKNEVLGKDLVQTYITEDYRESVKQVLDDALLGKETANYEFPLFAKDGKRVIVLLNSSTRRNAEGKIVGVLGVGQDISELVSYRNELENKVIKRTLKLNQTLKKEKELNELKSRFVSIASHEFRTPLSAITFAAGSMKKYWSKMEPIKIEEKLSKIEDQVMHMKRLLDDMLIIGYAQSGKSRNKPLNTNLGKFIDNIVEEVSSSSKKSHEIIIIDNKKLKNSTIFIDQKLGRNILINLLSNAIKFSPDADKVTIELLSEKNAVIISITDYGIGIPKVELKNIFKPFIRGENVDLIQGTGLGLTIVKDSINIIGGKIRVNSIVGKGSNFKVTLPINK